MEEENDISVPRKRLGPHGPAANVKRLKEVHIVNFRRRPRRKKGILIGGAVTLGGNLPD
jgi:hypothetical protein